MEKGQSPEQEKKETVKITLPYYHNPKTEGVFIEFAFLDYAMHRLITLIDTLLQEEAIVGVEPIEDANKLLAEMRKKLKDSVIQKNRVKANANTKSLVFMKIPFDQGVILWALLRVALEDDIADSVERRLIYLEVFEIMAKVLDAVIKEVSSIKV